MLIKTEYYTTDSGEKRKKEYYGKDESHISATIDSADDPIQEPDPMPELLSETEELIMDTNTKVSYIECLAELGACGQNN